MKEPRSPVPTETTWKGRRALRPWSTCVRSDEERKDGETESGERCRARLRQGPNEQENTGTGNEGQPGWSPGDPTGAYSCGRRVTFAGAETVADRDCGVRQGGGEGLPGGSEAKGEVTVLRGRTTKRLPDRRRVTPMTQQRSVEV